MKINPLSRRSWLLAMLAPLFMAAALAGCTSQGGNSQSEELNYLFDRDWAESSLWDDGLAEVATYDAERVIYNKSRSFDYTLITVKEDFNKAYNVKTDQYDRKDLFPVMKVNQFCRIPTDNYPYHFMTALYFRRENPLYLHKMTSSSQEWCGTTFKAITQAGHHLQFAFNSYWDGQGAGKMNLPSDLIFEDQLCYTLRSLKFKEGLNFSAEVAGLVQTSNANPPAIYQAAFRVKQDLAAGKPLWRVEVALSPQKQNTYWFARQYPHLLVQQQTWDGRSLVLKKVKRYAYWKH